MASASTQDYAEKKSPVADSIKYRKHENNLDKTDTRGKSLYLLISDIGRTKIGISCDPHHRMTSIRTSSPCKVELLNYFDINNASEIESELHNIYETCKIQGEWFDLSNKQLKNVHLRVQETVKENTDEKVTVKENTDKKEINDNTNTETSNGKNDEDEVGGEINKFSNRRRENHPSVDDLVNDIKEYELDVHVYDDWFKRLKYIYKNSEDLLKLEPYEINNQNLRVLYAVLGCSISEISMILDHHPEDVRFALVNCGYRINREKEIDFNTDHSLYRKIVSDHMIHADTVHLITRYLYHQLDASVADISNVLNVSVKRIISELSHSSVKLDESTKDVFSKFVMDEEMEEKLPSRFS